MNVSRELRNDSNLIEVSCNLTDLKNSLTKVIEYSSPKELVINTTDLNDYINKLK